MTAAVATTPSPALTVDHLDKLGAASVENLARLAFTAKHREHDQYRGFLDRMERVGLVRITRDPSAGLSTFSRYEAGDVLLAWIEWSPRLYGQVSEVVAYCPRVGWNVLLLSGCYEWVS